MQSSLVVLSVLFAFAAATAVAVPPQAKPGCTDHCGNLTIPYPFGIEPDCYMSKPFSVYCNTTTEPPILTWDGSSIPIDNIYLAEGEMQIEHFVAHDCYDGQGGNNRSRPYIRVPSQYFTVSHTRNKFVAVGCDTYALFRGYRADEFQSLFSGCMSICNDADNLEQSCSGVGCCKTDIPSGLYNYTVTLSSYYNHTYILGFNPCSYAFIVEEGKFLFSANTSFEELSTTEMLPMILNWEVGQGLCDEAEKRDDYACKASNSKCVNRTISHERSGYTCQCLPGYEGNPYLPDGCQDIDECEVNPCINGRCQNSPGSYSCLCDRGYITNGTKHQSCIQKISNNQAKTKLLIVSLSVIGGMLVLFIGISWICCGVKNRKLERERKRNFKENGGYLLQEKLKTLGVETTKVFTTDELEKATNNYHESTVLGEGGFGTVYKGILPGKKEVAIKKSKGCTSSQIEQFTNEVIVLSQINHRNVVKLLGCCLETAMPLLVYEFVTHGTLYEHIHKRRSSLSFELRIKIAAEAAGALAYLHSSTSMPIIHRDVKTANVLLDHNFTAKMSDFGASRLVPLGESGIQTLVLGTRGYLDPEYNQTNQLTEKSDVYSFGVVLVELLTSRVATSNDRFLASVFVSSMDEDCLREIFDDTIVTEGNFETAANVANLALRCLRLKGEERPTMKEVAMELEGMAIMAKHPWGKNAKFCSEESEYLLGSPASDRYESYDMDARGGDPNSSGGLTIGTTTGYDSIQIQMLMPQGNGR